MWSSTNLVLKSVMVLNAKVLPGTLLTPNHTLTQATDIWLSKSVSCAAYCWKSDTQTIDWNRINSHHCADLGFICKSIFDSIQYQSALWGIVTPSHGLKPLQLVSKYKILHSFATMKDCGRRPFIVYCILVNHNQYRSIRWFMGYQLRYLASDFGQLKRHSRWGDSTRNQS